MRDESNQARQVAASSYQPLVIVLCAVAAGMVADRYGSLPLPCWWIGGAAACAAWWLAARLGRSLIATACLLIALAAVGAAWHHAQWRLVRDDELGLMAAERGGPVCLEAVVRGPPRHVPAPPHDVYAPYARSEQTRLQLDVLQVRDARQWRAASGRVDLTVDGVVKEVRSGDRLWIVAQLVASRGPSNPGEFDFRNYARADGKYCRLFADSADCLELRQHGPRGFGRLWAALRSTGDGLLSDYLSAGRSGLATALLLGLRERLHPVDVAAFQDTGTVHLLSISGLHVGMLAGFLWMGLGAVAMPRGITLLLVAVVTSVYALVIDAEPPAVRATVMVLLACLAAHLGRRPLGMNVLAAAALLVLALNPADLFRTGPQLSFLAAAVLSALSPAWMRWKQGDALERLVAAARPWPLRMARSAALNFARGTAVSGAVWLVTLPLVLSRFHLVSPVTLVLTPLLMLPVAVALLSGFGILLTGGWCWPLAALLAAICDASLWLIQAAVQCGQAMPGATWWLPAPADWCVALFYALLAVWWMWPAGERMRNEGVVPQSPRTAFVGPTNRGCVPAGPP